MTLRVTAFRLHPDGSRTELPLPSNLAGTENARVDFYGADLNRKLGLRLLPDLKDGAVLACGRRLPTLLADVHILLDRLPIGPHGDYWRFRLDNIKAAIEAASAHGDAGCVEIA
jgi:hypothetical protein